MRERPAFLTSTANNSPSACTGISLDSGASVAFTLSLLLVQFVPCPGSNRRRRALGAEPLEQHTFRGRAHMVAGLDRDEPRDRSAMAGNHAAPALANVAEQLREVAVGVGRRKSAFHVVILPILTDVDNKKKGRRSDPPAPYATYPT